MSTSNAERQRRHRARVRRGEAILRVRVRPEKIIEALLRSQKITEDDAFNREKVEEALSHVVAEWTAERMMKIP